MPKQTPLYPAHLEAGAKIVDFAGWDMPIHYGSQLNEHHQVRRDSGMFDVSHMLPVDVTGAGAQAYLSQLLANNVAKLKEPGRALYSCMLDETGGVIDDLIVYYFAPDEYRVVVNAGTADKDIAWMRSVASHLPGGGNVTVTARRDLAMIAVQGPQARERFWAAFPAFKADSEALKPFQAAKLRHGVPGSHLEQEIISSAQTILARTGYTGEDGFELMLPAQFALSVWQDLKAAGVLPVGLGARDTLRLEAGMNLYGQDMDETVNPLESGLAWTVDLTPGREFIGRSALEAAPAARQLVGLLLAERGVLRAHMPVFTALGEGQTTSGSFAPTMNASIAFARVPAGVALGDQVDVDIRGKRLKAQVVKLPFVRHGKVLSGQA